MIVDSHVHVVGDDRTRFALPAGHRDQPVVRDPPCSGSRLRTLMADAGVDRAVLVQGVGAYGFDNAHVLTAAADSPGVFTPVVCTDRRERGAVGRVRVLVGRVPRVGTAGSPSPTTLASTGRARCGRRSARSACPVVTLRPDDLEALARVATDFPRVRLAVDHCAFVDFGRGVPDELATLVHAPKVFLEVSTHTRRGIEAEGIAPAGVLAEPAARAAGRILWGSDHPQPHDASDAALVAEGRAAARRLTPGATTTLHSMVRLT